MAEEIEIIEGDKQAIYESLLPQIKALVTHESDLIANLANVTSALKEQFGWLWVGFYFVKNEELVLGPFQGPIACTRIPKEKVFVEQVGKRLKPLLCGMLMLFRGILLAAVYLNPKL